MFFPRFIISAGALAAVICTVAPDAWAQVAVINQGRVTVTGTDDAEFILITQLEDQIVAVIDGAPTTFDVGEVLDVSVDALGGDDTVTVDVNRPTTILTGTGNDIIIGSDGGADLAIGQQGADTFFGRGGDDVFIWNPGDGNDAIDGNDGNDTHIFNGAGADETMVVQPNGARVLLTRNLGNISMDIGTFENISVNALGGVDTVSGAVGLMALVALLTLDGGAGNDIINGGDGNDMLIGGDGDDSVDGNGGTDSAFLGAGDDVFIWDPGDGSDFVEGEAGFDSMLFNGSAGSETFDASANGSRLRFFRNLGNIIMDVGTTEQIDLRAFGGDDNTTINDLGGTDVTDVIVDAGPGNDNFEGSKLEETFLAGEGDDTATMGDGDFFDMGTGIDALHFFGTTAQDNIHVNAKIHSDHDEAFFHGSLGKQRAVFDNGEIVTVFIQGDDRVKVHRKAAKLWDIEIDE